MRLRSLIGALLCGMVLTASSSGAQSDNRATPRDDKDRDRDYICIYVGGAFGGNMFVGTSGVGALDRGVPQNYGAAISWWGKGVFAGEADLTYYKDFFGPSNSPGLGANQLYTFTGNFVINPVSIDFSTQRIRPYFVIGGGLMRAQISDFLKYYGAETKNWGVVDAGAGIQYYPIHRIGLRADIRYYRAVGTNESGSGWGWINKWDWFRGSVGAAIAF
jgi:hypothetical protein